MSDQPTQQPWQWSEAHCANSYDMSGPVVPTDRFLREFDAAYVEGGIFQLTMHPRILGSRSRIFIVTT